MSRATRSATINDVAEKAGVSYQTVSRVINNHASVAPLTRERVQQAIQDLDYRPSLVAKGLVTRRSQLIGLIAYGTEQFGPAQIVQSVEHSARAHGFETMLTTLREFTPAEVQDAVARLGQFGVDGLALLTPLDNTEVARSIQGRTPFMLISAAPEDIGPSVSIDQFAGGQLATRHLLDLGHERILHIPGPRHWSEAELRLAGHREALAQANLEALPLLRVAGAEWSAEIGYATTLEALARRLDFTAVFAANDQMALGALAALKRSGRRVPDDVSVVGFDATPESAYYDPPLTTVRQDFVRLGERSVDRLVQLIAGEPPAVRHAVDQPELVVRATTGPKARAARKAR